MATDTQTGRVAYVVASAAVRHGAAAADDGYVGMAWKQKVADIAAVAKADLNEIKVSEPYVLVIRGEFTVPNTGLTSLAKGDLVYINTTTNALAASSGAGVVALGKVSSLAGERGVPAGRIRVNLDWKA